MISSISLQPIIWNNYNISEQKKFLARPAKQCEKKIQKNVKNILNQVQIHGDNALRTLNMHLDQFSNHELKITRLSLQQSHKQVSNAFKHAIQIAKNNISHFHSAQYVQEIHTETLPGIECRQITRPLRSVGLYIPSGLSPLPSTVMMLGIPAKLAGCQRIIICSPPPISNEILYTAQICEIKEIYQVGGAQAIAAMGFGTESIKKVNKIFGPGNIWVTEAKRQINYKLDTAIDMLAGPSEILIIADSTSNPTFIAADLLSQTEHGANSHTILLTPDIHIVNKVIYEINQQIKNLSRTNIITQALKNTRLIVNKDIIECITISNDYAPEHLSIQTKNPENILKHIVNAGSIFLGKWSAEAAGDYASGTNHVLPTYGYAKHTSSLGLADFQKRMTVQKLTKDGLLNLASTIETLAEVEQLTAHKQAINIRLNILKEKYGYL